MAESQSFSDGVDRLLQSVQPYGQTRSCWPRGLQDAGARRRPEENLRQWFVRLVDETCGGEPKIVALEDNIAVFLQLGWKDGGGLLSANIQTIVTTCDLEDYYLGLDAGDIYLRLDFDYKALGLPFSHPLVHVQLDSQLSPRFALDGGNCGNIVVDYLEFLYRNFAPAKWLKWVQRVWSEEFSKSAVNNETDPLPRVIKAFADGEFALLRQHTIDLDRIKRALRNRKDGFFKSHMAGADRIILEYPLAR